MTALAGSGPAFVYRFIDALAAGAAALGLAPEQAQRLALAMVEGAGALASASPYPPGELARRVASPGGTTVNSADRPTFAHTMPASSNSGFGSLANSPGSAAIKVLNGAAAGREVPLTKVVTTVGKPGVQVASITKRPGGYVLAHVEGANKPTVNGSQLAGDSAQLRNGDVIELAGTQMQFIQI